jgi:hypothetical protein
MDAKKLIALNSGQVESRTLMECLSIDFYELLSTCFPNLPASALSIMKERHGITKRMKLAALMLLKEYGYGLGYKLINHPSDTIRGIACYIIAEQKEVELAKLLEQIMPLADVEVKI